MPYVSKYKGFRIYRPKHEAKGPGGYKNIHEYVADCLGTIRSAKYTTQMIAQGYESEITHEARLYNANVKTIGFGYVETKEGLFGDIGPDWIVVNSSSSQQYKVVSVVADDEHESNWIFVTLLAVKDTVQV